MGDDHWDLKLNLCPRPNLLQLQNCVFVCIAPAVGVQSLMDATALISGSANYHIVQLNTFSNHLCSISCSCGIISPFTSLEPGSDSNVSTWWSVAWCCHQPDGAIQLVTGARSSDHHIELSPNGAQLVQQRAKW